MNSHVIIDSPDPQSSVTERNQLSTSFRLRSPARVLLMPAQQPSRRPRSLPVPGQTEHPRPCRFRPASWLLILLSAVLNPLRADESEKPDTTPRRQLTVHLVDADTGTPLSGIVRITRADIGKFVRPTELIPRRENWFTITPGATISVPATPLRIQALRGIQTEATSADVGMLIDRNEVTLKLRRFYDARQRGWRNGNTHLHLMDRSRIAAERYLREVPESDGLDLVYLSHLRRIPDESRYISNEIVEQSLQDNVLQQLSSDDVLLRPGEEHRHNFGRGGEGFGHVMLLDIAKLIRPVSIGPGIMRSGTDSTTLQQGILEAHRDGATVVWCHNSFGFEDIPNWVGGHLDAQNIFDGGSRDSYDASFYRYLNLGMKIPFSTGTDWFIEDFNRVYVPLSGELTSDAWLQQLKAGRSFITNGPMLEFSVDGHAIGDTLNLTESRELPVVARAVGRLDFRRLELIRNGEVVATTDSGETDGHYEADLKTTVLIDEPAWLAVRVALDAPKNEFARTVFAHTSPVYVDFNGRQPFQPEVALAMIAEIEESLQQIRVQAVFANDSELEQVMEVYREGIRILKQRIQQDSDS